MTLEEKKSHVNNFCYSEYGNGADFTDLSKVGVAYTEYSDEEDLKIKGFSVQIYLDLINDTVTAVRDFLDGTSKTYTEEFRWYQWLDFEDLILTGI